MFDAEKLAPLKEWKKEDSLKIVIAGDVGGSGIRVRISNFLDASFVDLGHAKAQNTEALHEILEDLGQKLKATVPDVQVISCALAVAGPIQGETVVMTNWLGKPAVRTLVISKLPEFVCPRNKTIFLNDLEAGAYGIVAANDQGTLEDKFQQLWPEAGAAPGPMVSNSRTAVLAMGSGLGVALITKNKMSPQPIVLPTEMGHIQIARLCHLHPNYEYEQKMVQHVSDHYYGGTQCPEYEDICSGRGLCLVYQHFKFQATGVKIPLDQIDAGEVAQLAREGDKAAHSALLAHYRMFMRAAKAVATSMSCDSVLLALDNQVKNAWFVASHSEELREEFYHFIRPDWVKNIRVYAQHQLHNFNILGCEYMARVVAKNE